MTRTARFLPLFGLFACMIAATAEESPYTRTENIVYEVTDGVGLILDVFQPTGEKNGAAVIDVLSGAWYSEEGQVRDHLRGGMFDLYCSRGLTVFMVRPGSRTLFSADEMVKHIVIALDWIAAHAEEYGIDPERIGITGYSAGGHLTLLTLTTTDAAKRLRAAGVFFPPTDFMDWGGKPMNFTRVGNVLFRGGVEGKSEMEIHDQAKALSPAHQVDAEDGLPPILIYHGDADESVPLQQSEVFVAKAKAAGVDVQLIVKPGGAHPWPTIPEEVGQMADWFLEKLAAK